MVFWLIQTGEQIPEFDGNVKTWRTYKLAEELFKAGYQNSSKSCIRAGDK